MAKMASTVDVLSHGRLDFGIGAGWYEHEYLAYGYDFPPTPGDRLRMLGEALQVITAMWTEPYASFEGNHYKISGAINEPKPVQKPHPPIWIGGSGEKVTLKLAAKYGDATNFGGHLDDMSWYKHKLDVIRGHCEDQGRDPATITHSTNVETTLLRAGDDPEQLTKRYRRDQSLAEVQDARHRRRPAGGHRHLWPPDRRRHGLHHRLGPAGVWPRPTSSNTWPPKSCRRSCSGCARGYAGRDLRLEAGGRGGTEGAIGSGSVATSRVARRAEPGPERGRSHRVAGGPPRSRGDLLR